MSESKITCQLCGAQVHAVTVHLRQDHPEVTTEKYQEMYPDAPLFSEKALARIAEKRAEQQKATTQTAMAGNVAMLTPKETTRKEALHEVFGLGRSKAALNGRGEAIPITVFNPHPFQDMVPAVDPNYVFDIELLKDVMLAIELGMPSLAWGHAGTGKSTLYEQICARTNRPFLRVQHTINTEESHILGTKEVNEKGTYWEHGPLPLAMKHGWFYLADEYDMSVAHVLGVYQPIMEGKALVIKEADAANRVIHRHKHFVFAATGNTNGTGDESGLYQGTNLQNAANYSRFGMTKKVNYMSAKLESQIIQNQAGLKQEDADKIVEFAKMVRDAFEAAKIGATVGPRELINAAQIGIRRGSFKHGLECAFINRLSRVDQEVVGQLAQRVFG